MKYREYQLWYRADELDRQLWIQRMIVLRGAA